MRRAAIAGFAASALVALAACAAPASPGDQAAWPPRLHSADERLEATQTRQEWQEQALRDAGTTVLRDRPYH